MRPLARPDRAEPAARAPQMISDRSKSVSGLDLTLDRASLTKQRELAGGLGQLEPLIGLAAEQGHSHATPRRFPESCCV